ncbi:exo-beta-1,3-glucanase [Fimbriiglobus ruber]|uniref:Endo-1,3-beta-glucanase btgC n=1 Tax=Fimbriiglobus ruber TaxID=1908690 RepID=A0A225DKK6_9BACT|nr:exo-beta-1,3-glucanase [Fimbriiglobus ruber]OWK37996.1 putative glucosyl transferase [Fimbriiglobus ruber]
MVAIAFLLFQVLTGPNPPAFIAYTPSELDPRQEVNQRRLATSSIRADLTAMRKGFDGLVLYGYHEANTPRILAVAKDLKYRSVILAIWDPKSAAEVDGVAELARLHEKDFALGVIVGNEGITFKRYEFEDLTIAAARLRKKLPAGVPITTSEPLVGYKSDAVVAFGDFLMPNIHPVFDRPNLGPVEAAAWAREEAVALAKRAKRPVVLKETGFPHGGKPAYTPETQKAYWEAYLKPGVVEKVGADNFAYFGIGFEAFDLPWKAQESGLGIEKYWGLYSTKREPFPAAGVWEGLKK